MDKVKKHMRNLPVLHTFILCVVFFILLALVFAEIEKTILVNAQRDITFRYSDIVEGYNNEKVWHQGRSVFLSPNDSAVMTLYETLLWLLPPITYLFCIIAAGIVFYRKKLKLPIKLLNHAAKKVHDNELDFTLDYDRQDEMGNLCASFEKMKLALQENNREMWRQMEERKRLNASFSHDLRTPLTVLEGHIGILKKYLPEGNISLDEALDTFTVMDEQVGRLKNYVTSMNTLQRLEDIPIQRQEVDCTGFIESLQDTAKIVCATKRLIFKNECNRNNLNIDSEIVMQVYENLLSNAIRYAVNRITITCNCAHSVLSICVLDDGCGFDEKGIKTATDPFYSTDKKTTDQHFGLGLNICKILCERHGGQILIGNESSGGAVVQVNFSMN